MAPKDQADQTERRSPLLLPNKISDARPALTTELRRAIREEVKSLRLEDSLAHFIIQMPMMTSILPEHWESFPSDLKMFLEKEMFDPVIKHILESDKLINWCPSVQKLYPLITPGDGNCLLHAVSLAMWAVDDSELVLRTALYDVLKADRNERNHLRWQRERIKVDSGIPGSGLRYNSTEWQSEWEMVKAIASPERRSPLTSGLPYESLEQYHVFMLANMLRRPIIVLAQDMMRSQYGHSLQPQHLHGIYLPLNWEPRLCYRYPILLGFYSNHFVPLLATAKPDSEEEALDHLVPIMRQSGSLMPVHFLQQEEEKRAESLLQSYLYIEEVLFLGESLCTARSILGVRLVCSNSRPDYDLMVPYMQLAETHFRAYLEAEFGNGSMGADPGAQSSSLHKDRETVPQSHREKSNSFPSASESSLAATGKHSWSGAPVSQVTGSPAPPVSRLFSLVNQACKTEGCIYYCSFSTGEYCHECFQKRNQSTKCAGDRCLNPPEQGCRDLCRVCYDQRRLTGGASARSSLARRSPDLSVAQAAGASADQSTGDILTQTRPLEKRSQECPGQAASSSSGQSVTRIDPAVQDPDMELNSMVIHQRLPTRKCIVPECPLTGEPSKSDMCGMCYAQNLQAVEELRRASQVKDDQPAAEDDVEQSAPGATAYGNAIVEGARPKSIAKAAAAAPKPLQPESVATKITVQKNLCARAGCEGIRLVHPSFQGYCIACHKRNTNEASAALPVQDLHSAAPRANADWQVAQNLPRSGRKAAGVKDITGILATKPTPQRTSGDSSRIEAPYVPSSTAATATGAAAAAAAAAASTDKICVHPRCSNPAAPPKFLLCEECIQISEMFYEKGTEGSASGQAAGSEVQAPEPTAAKPEDAVKPEAKWVPSIPSKAELDKLAAGFKNVRIIRVKCQVAGGCADEMFGDPELDNLCSRCFAKMTFRRGQNRASAQPQRAETRPLSQPPANHYNTAPIKPSPRVAPVKPSSQTEVIFINRKEGQTGGTEPGPLPDNYRACASPGCANQANLQILEGFCNDCHQVYRNQQHLLPAKAALPGAGPVAASRGRLAQSSQSTMPEAWHSPPARPREEKILNVEVGRRAPPMARTNRTDMKCLSPDCTNHGNPRCQGYCNSCFRLVKN